MRRGTSSAARPRTKLRMAALVAAHTLNAGVPLFEADEPVSMIEAPSRSSGRAFWTVTPCL